MDLALFKSYELLLLLLLLLKRFPVFQASKANEPTHAFYSLPEFESWKNETENWKAWKVKYYKGRFVGLLVCVCVSKHFQQWTFSINTVEPHYNEVLGTMKITSLYQVSHYIMVKTQRNIN